MEYVFMIATVALGLLTAWRLSDWCVGRFCERWNRDQGLDCIEADQAGNLP